MFALSTWAIIIEFMLKWAHAHLIELGPKHIAYDQTSNSIVGFRDQQVFDKQKIIIAHCSGLLYLWF